MEESLEESHDCRDAYGEPMGGKKKMGVNAQCHPQGEPDITEPLPRVDAWRNRSLGLLCRSCMWHVKKNHELGRCRRHAPTLSGYPAVYWDDWCGDHKLK